MSVAQEAKAAQATASSPGIIVTPGIGNGPRRVLGARRIDIATLHWVAGGTHILALADDADETTAREISFLRPLAPGGP